MEIFCPEELQSVKEIFQKAEDAIKLIEHIHNLGMVTPAVNELRYAGNHMFSGLSAVDAESQAEQFDKAERHCQRAIYDAIEVGALDCFTVFDVFADDYKLVVISDVCPEYNEIQDLVAGVRDFVKQAQKSEKKDYYEELETKYDALKDAVDKLERRRPQLNAQMALVRRNGKRWGAMFVVAILAIVASASFSYMGQPKSDNSSALKICMQGVVGAKPNSQAAEAMQICEKFVSSNEQGGEKQTEESADK